MSDVPVLPDDVDYAYFFTIWNGQHISGYPALLKDVIKVGDMLPGFVKDKAAMAPPVVVIVLRFTRALEDKEVDILADEVRGGLIRRRIKFTNIELTHVARIAREGAEDGKAEEGVEGERPIAG